MLSSLSYLINAEFPGDVVPLREEAELNILLVDVHPHAKVVEQLATLLQGSHPE
jgi:hypothetical protein